MSESEVQPPIRLNILSKTTAQIPAHNCGLFVPINKGLPFDIRMIPIAKASNGLREAERGTDSTLVLWWLLG